MLKLFEDKVTQDFIKTSFGNIIEWYDFTLYGLFALQISRTFFPTDSQFISLLLVFMSFAIGFVARPMGSFIFGYIGDVKGKHYAVNLSIWCMAIPTVSIGLIPSFNVLGIFSPILLVFLRIIQGLSAGGQFSGLIAIAVESQNKRKAFLVSLVDSISVVGCFAASFIGFLSIEFFSLFHGSNEILRSLNWRVPFLLSSVTFALYLKLKPDFKKHKADPNKQFSFKEIFNKQPKEVFSLILLGTGLGSIYYILFTYLVTYMQTQLHLNKPISFFIMNLMLLISIILYPVFGYFADYSSNRIDVAKWLAMMFSAAIAMFFFAKMNLIFIILSWVIMLISFCAMSSFTMSLFAQIFHEKYSMSACSITYNVGFCVSGFAPFISEILSRKFTFGLQYFLVAIIFIMFVAIWQLEKTPGYQKVLKQKNLRHQIKSESGLSLKTENIA